MNPLLERLRYPGASRVAICNMPYSPKKFIQIFPEAVEVNTSLEGLKDIKFVMYFVQYTWDIEKLAQDIQGVMNDYGALWVVFPRKGTQSISTDLKKDSDWRPMIDAGFNPIKTIKLDLEWAATRYRKVLGISSVE